MEEQPTIIHPHRTEALRGGGMRVFAPAKINLNLLVGRRREDGYHPLDSFVGQVSLADTIDIVPADGEAVAFACRGADCGADEKNLAYRAATMLMQRSSRKLPGARITLDKAIPPGKGLGGGSSDAAAVLWAMNEYWRLGVAAGELMSLAAQLGSDVPLFLGPPACRMRGRGEVIGPAAISPFHAVLVLPPCQCATPLVYRAFDEQPQDMLPQLDASVLAGPVRRWRGLLCNQLAGPARAVSPELGTLWDELAAAARLPVHLTGSGSALFIPCDDAPEAQATLARIPAAIRPLCHIIHSL